MSGKKVNIGSISALVIEKVVLDKQGHLFDEKSIGEAYEALQRKWDIDKEDGNIIVRYIPGEIDSLFLIFESQDGVEIARIKLTGGPKNYPDLVECFCDSYRLPLTWINAMINIRKEYDLFYNYNPEEFEKKYNND